MQQQSLQSDGSEATQWLVFTILTALAILFLLVS
jgi:hypothetical protein